RLWLILAAAVWLTHNMVDIDVYFPSVGIIGAGIIGVLLAREEQQFPSAPRVSLAAAGGFALAMVFFAALNCVSSELQQRAQIEYENKKLPAAVATLEPASE